MRRLLPWTLFILAIGAAACRPGGKIESPPPPPPPRSEAQEVPRPVPVPSASSPLPPPAQPTPPLPPPPSPPTPPPPPPPIAPGPIVIIGGGTGSPPGTVTFEVQTGAAALAPLMAGGPASGGLHPDFIGRRVAYLLCDRGTGSWEAVDNVSAAEGPDPAVPRLIVERTEEGLLWTLIDRSVTPPLSTVLIPGPVTAPTAVPQEFLQLRSGTLRDTESGRPCYNVLFQVYREAP